MVEILIMSVKLVTLVVTLGLLKTKVFWNKDYVIISIHDVTNKTLSRD